MGGLGQDARYGWRQLVRYPALTAVVTIALAAGIGMNAAVFSVIRGVILRPLPYPESDRIVMVEEQGADGYTGPVSGPDFLDWRDRAAWAERLGAFLAGFATLTGDGEAQRVRSAHVTAGLFEVVRARPALGRIFDSADEERGNEHVVVLAHPLWAERFGSDSTVLGRTMAVNGEQYVVVGVMPPGFNMPSPWSGFRLWMPLSQDSLRQARDWRRFGVFGRLAQGTAFDRAVADMQRVAEDLAREYPESNRDIGINMTSLDEAFLGDAQRQLSLLLMAATFVLLIACANVAGLLLTKATSRGTEIAIRAAVGAHRLRLIRQFLTESIILSAVGGIVGILVALWCLKLFGALMPRILPRTDQIGMDWLVLGYAMSVSLLTGILFGLAPALSASRVDLASTLKAGRGVSPGKLHRRFRSVLVVGQFSLTLVLASGAGLMLKSYLRLRSRAVGFSPENTLVLDVTLQGPRYERADQRWDFFQEVLTRVRSLPGVEYVGATSKLPIWGGSNTTVILEGREYDPDAPGPLIELSRVFPGHARALGIPVLSGRDVTLDDTAVANPGAVINQAMARQVFPGQDPLGRRFSWERDPPHWLTIVGVAGDVLQWGLESDPQPEIYVPYTVMPRPRMYVVVRSEVEPSSLGPAVRREMAAVDASQPASAVFTMADVLAGATARRRFNTLLVTVFAGVALVLVAAGIYGVVSHHVAQSKHELGVRIALGANPRRMVRLVVRRGATLATIGSLIGLVGVYAATRVLSSLLYDVRATDPVVLAAGTLFVLTVGFLGSLIPALRVLRIDPVQVLRGE